MSASIKYRASCTCGYRGRWFLNGNDAVDAEERHLFSHDHNTGRSYDRSGHGHSTSIEEAR